MRPCEEQEYRCGRNAFLDSFPYDKSRSGAWRSGWMHEYHVARRQDRADLTDEIEAALRKYGLSFHDAHNAVTEALDRVF